MCGIAGAIGVLAADTDRAVEQASGSLLHRGPDGFGFFRSHDRAHGPGVHFAHRRLSIIAPTEEGRQPMVDSATGNVICFNGEIYNFKILRRQLSDLGATFETATDTEVILKAYAHWGAACLERMRGMFAFALLDRSTGRTMLARDRMGIKPLYYSTARRNGELRAVLFSSEIRALLCGGLVGRRIHRAALATYMWNGFVTGSQTIIDGVLSLDAGTFMWVGDAGEIIEHSRYWNLPSAEGPPTGEEEFAAALGEAVQQHLISDVPLGVFLSGGIDSSAIAALATEESDTRVRTFNISFAERGFDEAPWARRVAAALGTDHHEIRLTQAHFQVQLEDALSCLDQPSSDALNTYFVSRAAREAGVTVALSGLGGDEIFGGYRSFVDVPRARTWSRRSAVIPIRLLRGLARGLLRVKAGASPSVPPQTRWGKIEDVLTCRGDTVDLYQTSYALFTQSFLARLSDCAVTPGVSRGLTTELAERLRRITRSEGVLHAISLLELSLYVGERLLRDTDMASMRSSLEVRVPFLDHAVIEVAARLPESLRFRPIREKRLLRSVALRRLPPQIFDRPKAGFVLPIDVWSRQALHADIHAAFHDGSLCESVGLEQATLLSLWQAYLDGAPGIYWTRIWAIYALLHWVRAQHVSLA